MIIDLVFGRKVRQRYSPVWFVIIVFVPILCTISSSSFFSVFAEDVVIPKWVLKIYDYWKNGEITDQEFSNAIEYLENLEIIQLGVHKEYDVKTIKTKRPSPSKIAAIEENKIVIPITGKTSMEINMKGNIILCRKP